MEAGPHRTIRLRDDPDVDALPDRIAGQETPTRCQGIPIGLDVLSFQIAPVASGVAFEQAQGRDTPVRQNRQGVRGGDQTPERDAPARVAEGSKRRAGAGERQSAW